MRCDRCGKQFRHCDSYNIVIVPGRDATRGVLNVHPGCRLPSEMPDPPKPPKWVLYRGWVTNY